MASESEARPSPSFSSSNATESYMGSFISLISKFEIRYEGVLSNLNVQDSTIGLKNVRSYGTEGRKKDGPQILPGDQVYEYILFRGSDIKDLQVKSSPAAPAAHAEQIHNDPAIIQSHYDGMHSNSSPFASNGGKTLTESTQWQDTPALKTRAYPGVQPSYQSVTQVGPLDHVLATQGLSSSTPLYWQGHDGTSVSVSHAPQQPISFLSPSSESFPLTMPRQLQAPKTQVSTTPSLLNTSEFGTPVSSYIASASVHQNSSASLSPVSLDMPSSLSIKSSLLHSASMTTNGSNVSSFPSSCIDIKASEAQIVGKAVSDPRLVLPVQPMAYPVSPYVDSLGPLLTPSPSLVSTDQLTQSRPRLHSSTQKLYPDKSDLSAPTPGSSRFSSLISMPISQAPLLPLPSSSQQSQHSAAQFTEEFNFMAMNEKFKKDEVWGYLGKTKDKTEGIQDYATGQSLGNTEGHGGHGLIPNPKSAYNKDEFFDTISCNSLNRGARNGQNRFSERIRLDTETFGNFQQRPEVRYGGYAGGRGNFQASYNCGRGYGYGGRGYGYGGRGRGRNMPF